MITDFVGVPDARLAAEEVRTRIEDLNRALEYASRMHIAVTLNIALSTYEAPSVEVPLKLVLTVPHLCLSTQL